MRGLALPTQAQRRLPSLVAVAMLAVAGTPRLVPLVMLLVRDSSDGLRCGRLRRAGALLSAAPPHALARPRPLPLPLLGAVGRGSGRSRGADAPRHGELARQRFPRGGAHRARRLLARGLA